MVAPVVWAGPAARAVRKTFGGPGTDDCTNASSVVRTSMRVLPCIAITYWSSAVATTGPLGELAEVPAIGTLSTGAGAACNASRRTTESGRKKGELENSRDGLRYALPAANATETGTQFKKLFGSQAAD